MKVLQLVSKLLVLIGVLTRALPTKRRQDVVRRISRLAELSVHVLSSIVKVVKLTQRQGRGHRCSQGLCHVVDLFNSGGRHFTILFTKVGARHSRLHRFN